MPRVRLSNGTHEVELEGSEEFIDEHLPVVARMLEQLPSGATTRNDSQLEAADSAIPHAPSIGDLEFGEALFMLPDSASGTDKILLAGKFAQTMSDTNTFDTREANQLLLGQGIRLANPSQSLKNNLKAKRVFKFEGKYRVSRDGEGHLESLITQARGETRRTTI